MTEQEWDRCTDPEKMLEFLRGKASERKLLLFSAACCRGVWQYPEKEPDRDLLQLEERYADGLATREEWQAARQDPPVQPGDEYMARPRPSAPRLPSAEEIAQRRGANAGYDARRAVLHAARARRLNPAAWEALWGAAERVGRETAAAATAAERAGQASLLRDLLGPWPFRPVSLDPAWLAWHGGAIPNLAQAVYGERLLPSGHLDAARLAILADMLEEAGCTDAELLGHLRGPGPHVRGCWAVDGLLDKS